MTKEQLVELQKRIGTKPDGWWGPLSRKACIAHLLGMMPNISPWPRPDTASMEKFYGDPWDNRQIISVKAPSWMKLYEGHRRIEHIYVHERCADSMLTAINDAYDSSPNHLSKFYGCHVDRNTRGCSVPSKHAYGCAIDFAALTNRNHQHWPVSADMPIEVMESFARVGWTPAGAFWDRDAMHFQATQPF